MSKQKNTPDPEEVNTPNPPEANGSADNPMPNESIIAVLEGIIQAQDKRISDLEARIGQQVGTSVKVEESTTKKKEIIYLKGDQSYKLVMPRFQVPNKVGGTDQVDLTSATQAELGKAYQTYPFAFKAI